MLRSASSQVQYNLSLVEVLRDASSWVQFNLSLVEVLRDASSWVQYSLKWEVNLTLLFLGYYVFKFALILPCLLCNSFMILKGSALLCVCLCPAYSTSCNRQAVCSMCLPLLASLLTGCDVFEMSPQDMVSPLRVQQECMYHSRSPIHGTLAFIHSSLAIVAASGHSNLLPI